MQEAQAHGKSLALYQVRLCGSLYNKRLVVYLSNLWDKKSFAHEIAHVLGLVHSFQEKSSNDDINYMNSFITKIDAELNSMIENNDSQDKIARIWSQRKDEYSEYKRYLNVLYRNPYIFEESKTENIMDYNNNGISFWKHQWIAMQDDMIKFYNIK